MSEKRYTSVEQSEQWSLRQSNSDNRDVLENIKSSMCRLKCKYDYC